MNALQQYPHAGLCSSDPAILDWSGKIIGRALRWAQEPRYLSPDELVAVMNWNRFIWGFSVIVPHTLRQAVCVPSSDGRAIGTQSMLSDLGTAFVMCPNRWRRAEHMRVLIAWAC